jgi:hypothetical protein
MLRQDWTKALADIEIAIRNVQSGVDRAQLIVNRGVIHLKSGAPDAARRDFIQGCRMGNPMGCKLDSALSRP